MLLFRPSAIIYVCLGRWCKANGGTEAKMLKLWSPYLEKTVQHCEWWVPWGAESGLKAAAAARITGKENLEVDGLTLLVCQSSSAYSSQVGMDRQQQHARHLAGYADTEISQNMMGSFYCGW